MLYLLCKLFQLLYVVDCSCWEHGSGLFPMEIYKPQGHLTEEDRRNFETHLLTEKSAIFESPQRLSDENELLLW